LKDRGTGIYSSNTVDQCSKCAGYPYPCVTIENEVLELVLSTQSEYVEVHCNKKWAAADLLPETSFPKYYSKTK